MRKKAGSVVLLLTVLASLAAGYYGWQHWQLARDGTMTTARSLTVDRQLITGKNVTGLPYRYVADYTFTDESGTVRNGRQTIDRSRYDELAARAPDAPVSIYFSRSNPAVNALDPNSSRNVAVILGLIALLGWALFVARKVSG